jgi:hypothetical protein
VWLARFGRLELVVLLLWLPGRRTLKTFYAGHRLLPRTSRLDWVLLASLGCVLKDGGDTTEFFPVCCAHQVIVVRADADDFSGGRPTRRIWVLNENVISDGQIS